MPLKIRPGEPGDTAAVAALFRETVQRICCRDYDPEQIQAWIEGSTDLQRWSQRWASRKVWVAQRTDRIVGFIEWLAPYHIDALYVDADHQREGIGSALLDRLEAASADEPSRTLFADVSLTARPFFAAKGYEVLRDQTLQLHGRRFRSTVMRKTW